MDFPSPGRLNCNARPDVTAAQPGQEELDMPGIRECRTIALAIFLSAGLLPSSQAGEQAHTLAQHLRARTYVQESGQHPEQRAQAMRYTRMAVLRAKCELHNKDKRRCARYTAGANPKMRRHPATSTPGVGAPAGAAPAASATAR